MQKVFNLFSTVAFVGVVAIGAGAGYVALNKDAIIENVKAQVAEQIGEAVGGAIGGSLGGGLPAPSSPAGGGLPIPF